MSNMGQLPRSFYAAYFHGERYLRVGNEQAIQYVIGSWRNDYLDALKRQMIQDIGGRSIIVDELLGIYHTACSIIGFVRLLRLKGDTNA